MTVLHLPSPAATAMGPAPAQTVDQWLSLVTAVERLSAAESLDQIIQVVRDTARAISGADGVCFVLRDEDRCHYVEENAVGPLWKGRRFPMTACISGWCMIHAEMAVIPDIYADPRIPHDAYRPTFVKSLVMTPVRASDPLAAIGCYWAEERSFSDVEVALLDGLGRSTAAAITAVQARETLRESEARLRLALSAGQLGAWELELDSYAVSGSPEFDSSFSGRPAGAFTRGSLLEAVHPEDRDELAAALADAADAGSDFSLELRALRPGGEARWIELRGRAVRDANDTAVRLAGVSLDITERRQAQARIEGLRAELAHVGRLSEMGKMSSALAHELNQPLAAASNYLGAARRLLDGEGDPSSLGRAMQAIDKANGQFVRAGEIIRRVRGFSRKGESIHSPEDVAALAEEAIEIAWMDPRWRDVDLRLAVQGAPPPASADRVQVQQVLLNLLRNACEVMEGREVRTVLVTVSSPSDEEVEVCVADSGPGLPDQVAARLFEPFVTTKADGMGVGLSLCRDIVESHGGRMWAGASDLGGAAFSFTLPAARAI